MSASTVRRIFKDVTAISPLRYQKTLRLSEAQRVMLKNVQMSRVNKDGSAHFEFTAAGADVYAAMASLYQTFGDEQYLDYGDVYYTRLVGGDYDFDWKPTAWAISDGTVSSYLTADHWEPDDEFLTASAQYTPPGEDPFDSCSSVRTVRSSVSSITAVTRPSESICRKAAI